jgi:hypothetical protein
MFFADFVTIGSDRYWITADVSTGKTRAEKVSNEAFERFIRNVLTMPDPLDPACEEEMSV